ncbi:MAG: hypothetical protein U5N26_12500 [Candidatus Marinimicrobia bacterium]|nr:hypothetical protein [Candidatus Neomarinimicrobiota bacterium]
MKITDMPQSKEFKNTLDDNGQKTAGSELPCRPGCCGPLFGLEVVEKGKSGDKIIVQDGINFFSPRMPKNRLRMLCSTFPKIPSCLKDHLWKNHPAADLLRISAS